MFIRQLQHPMRDKIVLGILMGCGLVATAAGILKMIYIHRTEHQVDLFYTGVDLAIYSYVWRFESERSASLTDDQNRGTLPWHNCVLLPMPQVSLGSSFTPLRGPIVLQNDH